VVSALNEYTSNRIGNIVTDHMGDVQDRYDVGGIEMVGRPTGYYKVDEMTGGMSPDELWIVASRMGMGKSANVIQIALEEVDDDKHVLLFSLEMSGEMVVNRILSSMSGVAAGRIVRGIMEPDELDAVSQAALTLLNKPIYIFDQPFTSDQVVEVAQEIGNVGLTIVDYAGILSDPKGSSEQERMTYISRNMKKLAKPTYTDAPVILVAQLNRASEQNEGSIPTLANISQSDSFAMDASAVIFPFRSAYYGTMKNEAPADVEDAKIVVAKNRNGPMGATNAKFYPKLMKWEQKKAKIK
jgi:replicative DNA helicase